MTELPERIYLQWDGVVEGTTWCLDKINDDDGVYVLESRAEVAERKLGEALEAFDSIDEQLNNGAELYAHSVYSQVEKLAAVLRERKR